MTTRHRSDRSHRSQSRAQLSQQRAGGFSLIGLLCTLIVLWTVGLLALRAGPGVIEYWAVEKAVKAAAATSSTPDELRATFDKLAAAGFIDAIEGKDLKISGRGNNMQVSFAYEKHVPLYGPARLVIDYRGSTAEAGHEAGNEAGKAPEGVAK